MPQVLVLGAGKIGSLVAGLLSASGRYHVHLADLTLDAPKRLVDDLSLSAVTPSATRPLPRSREPINSIIST